MTKLILRYPSDNIARSRAFLRYKGGKGSGNFAHAGRPGKVGGSGSGNALDLDNLRSSFFDMGIEVIHKTQGYMRVIANPDSEFNEDDIKALNSIHTAIKDLYTKYPEVEKLLNEGGEYKALKKITLSKNDTDKQSGGMLQNGLLILAPVKGEISKAVIYHELGHAVYNAAIYGKKARSTWRDIYKQSKSLLPKGIHKANDMEAFSEMFSNVANGNKDVIYPIHMQQFMEGIITGKP